MININILVAGHDLKFLQFYIKYLESLDVDVRIDKWRSHTEHDRSKSFELLDWADIIFCEWGLGNAVFYSKYKRPHQKLVIRVHRQELITNYMSNINYNNVDYVICVSPFIYEEFKKKFMIPRHKMKLIYNQIDFSKFENKNYENRKYNIGLVGYLPKLKRLDIALDIIEELYKVNPQYKLYLKGKRPEELQWLYNNPEQKAFYEQQFQRIRENDWGRNVIFEPFGEVVDFYNRMEYILSVSDVESFHLSVAEGMVCGATPIITNWKGSETIYPNKFIIENNTEKLADFILNYNETFDFHNYYKYFNQKRIIKYLNHLVLS